MTQSASAGIYRILVTGWRAWPRAAAFVVHRTLQVAAAPVLKAERPVVVTEGQCPYGGADDYAYEWTRDTPGVVGRRIPAKWKSYGQSAGSIRNQVMVDEGQDICLAFPGPAARSRGTRDCVERAKKARISLVVVPWTPEFLDGSESFDPSFYFKNRQPQLGWEEDLAAYNL